MPSATSPGSNLYALILAGGSGERFWPMSRNARPKQLLKLFSDRTLLEDTIGRLDGLVPRENILVLTNRIQEPAVRAACTGLPEENIVAEPAKRDTAPAIALGAAWISRRNPQAVMVVLPADHVIKDAGAFRSDILASARAALRTGDLVTIGIKPTWACPSFGYIELGPEDTTDGDASTKIFEVRKFREKPNADLAESFLRQGHFRWNAGIFIWSVNSIITEFNRHAHKIASFISCLHQSTDFAATVEKTFPTLPKISIDYAVLENASRVLCTESTFDWDDVGTWTAAAKYFKSDADHNTANTPVASIDSSNNLVFADPKRQIALLGVSNLIIVQTEDALLVCNVHEAEKIKALVQTIPPELQ